MGTLTRFTGILIQTTLHGQMGHYSLLHLAVTVVTSLGAFAVITFVIERTCLFIYERCLIKGHVVPWMLLLRKLRDEEIGEKEQENLERLVEGGSRSLENVPVNRTMGSGGG